MTAGCGGATFAAAPSTTVLLGARAGRVRITRGADQGRRHAAAEPRTAWLRGSIEQDEQGFIRTGRDLYRAGRLPAGWPLERPPLLLETSIPGVFAAGDVRHRSIKRVAAAVGEGATAIQLVHEYLQAGPD